MTVSEPGLPSSEQPRPHVDSLEQYKQQWTQSVEDPDTFFGEAALKELKWITPPTTIRSGSFEDGDVAWFHDGYLNASVNCVDRWALKSPNKPAIIWESDEPNEHVIISYSDLLKQVCMVANVLKSFGVKKGDVVAIYLPMVPEAVYAMLACARIGAIHSVVFAGFSAEALRDRIQDANCDVLITVSPLCYILIKIVILTQSLQADQGYRGSKRTHLKKIADQALTECPTVKRVLVLQRTGDPATPFHPNRDFWWHEQIAKQRPYCPPEVMNAEDPLFILYTSGSTGKPKGVLHTTAGYLLGAALSTKLVFDVHEGDRFGCTADVGWITGHTYIVYGPLVIGTTTLVFESIPTYPNPGRYWQMIDTHKLTHFYTAPTAIRALRRLGDKHVAPYRLDSLRVLGSVGEPINPEAWHWYNDVIGKGRCPIVDTYWQTEAGSIMITPLPGAISTKPGAATLPFFGLEAAVLDPTTGKVIEGNEVEGVLCMKRPWPSMARTIYGDHKRYLETYMSVYKGFYFTVSVAFKRWAMVSSVTKMVIFGSKVELTVDVINVSGHRLSTAEIESALILHPKVAEAAVVAIDDDLTGQAIFAYVVLKDEGSEQSASHLSTSVAHIHHDSHSDTLKKMTQDLVHQVRSHIGPFASPKRVLLVPDLPKTRSGKIMRRILRKIANGDDSAPTEEEIGKLGDLSTLADPSLTQANSTGDHSILYTLREDLRFAIALRCTYRPKNWTSLYFTRHVNRQVGFLAQKRLARGVKLNFAEATALIASQLLELIRDGKHSVAQLMDVGRKLLGRRHVLPSVLSVLHEVQVEGTFPDGSKLVTIHDPISSDDGDLELALYGSFLPIPKAEMFPLERVDQTIVPPGGVVVQPGKISLNTGRKRVGLKVTNNGDRPVQVGSHYHFIETNPLLVFDRILSYGKRLDIPAGTAVRFEPGETKTITLVDIAGNKIIKGGNNVATGKVEDGKKEALKTKMKQLGFGDQTQDVEIAASVYELDKKTYADFYGPTTGDKVRLADTSLFLEVEHDYTVYGDECKFGGGKVLRDGMGQAAGVTDAEALDLVITNALVVDWSGIFKADIGIKKGFIVGIGKAGNPDVMAGVTPGMIIGPTTEALAGEGHIFTAGAIDAHVHFICPQICTEAIASGVTTLIGGGTGPNTGTKATTCTSGVHHTQFMLTSTDELPLNFAFTGKGNAASAEGLEDQILAGAAGLKLHEDWGTTPSAIDACIKACEKYDVQATIHTDTLNESGFVESSIAAINGRSIHAYHTEGAGGGHAPDIIRVVGESNVIPSSTNPTRAFTVNTLDEHVDMLMVCHHLSRSIPEDVAFAESRIRAETIQAEDILHDMGAISIISSDSQAMGRVGEVVSRTWHTGSKMKDQRGWLKGGQNGVDALERNDNFRIKRYIAKYTINPAIVSGISHIVGSVEVGKFADLVMYQPALFGTKPELVIKGGLIAYCQMGDANASIPTTQPVISRPMYAGLASAAAMSSIAFVSKAAVDAGVALKYGLRKRVEAVKGCSKVRKVDMKLNASLPKMKVDPETYSVWADGELLQCAAATKVPMSQDVYLF
ncbi:hypothetical protein HDU93_004470 [Gonapodya sp. JEL0774]|nr:hypothetical protein HDU93_004470 [Gonapodya sp. JEL0774]